MKKSPIELTANQMADELEADTKALVASLVSEIQQVGASKMTHAEFIALVHRNWMDSQFRADLLKQYGNKQFLTIAREMVANHGQPPVPALTVPPMTGSPVGAPAVPTPIPTPPIMPGGSVPVGQPPIAPGG